MTELEFDLASTFSSISTLDLHLSGRNRSKTSTDFDPVDDGLIN